MRTAITILIMFCLSLQAMVKVAIVGWYELNKDYIAKNLCENRDKPRMKCCGKCYLRKQLKKADEGGTTEKQSPVKFTKIELAEFVIPQKFSIKKAIANKVKNYNPTLQHMFGYNLPVNIFHPPAVLC